MSPLLAGMKIITRGTGNLRSKIYQLDNIELARKQFTKPIRKGRGSGKRRRGDEIKKEGQKMLIHTSVFDRKNDRLIKEESPMIEIKEEIEREQQKQQEAERLEKDKREKERKQQEQEEKQRLKQKPPKKSS